MEKIEKNKKVGGFWLEVADLEGKGADKC